MEENRLKGKITGQPMPPSLTGELFDWYLFFVFWETFTVDKLITQTPTHRHKQTAKFI